MKTFLNILVLSFLLGCTLTARAAENSLIKAQLGLNWKPEPEFGGFYEAQQQAFYRNAGLDIEILEGGSGTPTLQMLTNEKVDYAILSAEEIILHNDRDPKRKVVAVFTVFEKSPYMIMTHEEANLTALSQVFQNSHYTISLQKGLPYVDFLIKKYSPVQAKLVPYQGGIGLFEKNKQFAQQGFITSEYLMAQNQKISSRAWLVADEGFNPYITVLAVREDFLKKNRIQVEKMVQATRQGWESYLKKPDSTNSMMNKKNPAMSLEMMKASLLKMTDLMKFDPKLKLGQMKSERWLVLQQQMQNLQLIQAKNSDPIQYFQNF